MIQCLDQHQANLHAINRVSVLSHVLLSYIPLCWCVIQAGKTPLDLSVEANKPATADHLRKAIENRGDPIVKVIANYINFAIYIYIYIL